MTASIRSETPESSRRSIVTAVTGKSRSHRRTGTSMPFGLRNAPATFQRAIDIELSGLRWQTCLIYLDDVIVFSKDTKEHVAHVDQVLTLL